MLLNNDTFMIFAAKHYDGKLNHGIEEFNEDMKRFQYLRRLFKRYDETGELKERLILNHLIILYNCFGINTTQMLFFRMAEYHKYLKPFIVFLNYMPEKIEYDGKTIIATDIQMDKTIVEILRKI